MRWLLAAVSLFALVAWCIDRAGVVVDATPSDVIVVLGARVQPDGAPSPMLRERVTHAVTLFHRGLAPRLIVSGGVGDFGGSEASVGCALAVQLGVPREACVLEDQSHSTAQNAAFTAALLGTRTAILVTDPSHLPRARRLFARNQIAVTGSPVLTAPRHVDLAGRVYWTCREVLASLKDEIASVPARTRR